MKIQMLTGLFAIAMLATSALANTGYDKPTEKPGISVKSGLIVISRRGRGADDAPGHQRRCRGCDDGPNHT